MTEALILREDRTELIHHTIQLWIKTKTEASESMHTKEAYEQAITSFRMMTLAAGIDLDGFAPTISLQHITFDEKEHALAALGLLAQAWASSAHKEKQLQQGIRVVLQKMRERSNRRGLILLVPFRQPLQTVVLQKNKLICYSWEKRTPEESS